VELAGGRMANGKKQMANGLSAGVTVVCGSIRIDA
jgi:hypothetical protein